MKKIIFIFIILIQVVITSGCWNYKEINDVSIAAGIAVDYDKEKDKVISTTEIVYPMVTNGETKIQPEVIKAEGRNIFESIRNMIPLTGKKVFWAHAKVIIISEEVAKNEDILISLIDFAKRDAEYRDDIWVILSKEKTAGEILKTDVMIQDIVSFQLEDILKNEKGVEKYHSVPLWKFADDLSSEGIEPTLPTVGIASYKDKKIAQMYGTGVFKGAKLVGWLNGDETKSFLFIMGKINGGVIIVNKDTSKRPVRIGLEIFKNKTKIKSIYEDGEIKIKINTKTTVNINELESQIDFISEQGRSIVKKEAEKLMENKIKNLIKKVQKEYDSDIFGFGSVIEREHPEIWKEIKNDWDKIFRDLKIEVKSEIKIRGSALRSKPIKVGS
ncbi:Ger(x)C family spore germination protein [Crassaminicella thermophila]|uniref:Ger(X)C family spore germination protein n=1 Tax=Crassaminicella thermophila TaxID=2599308 RepID=A0A5C0SCP5_CRATE|nr:Ger(x)C family spore germination protein [Crassaminicella thermophila]QEK11218.1 Ger(x)C family spore germination protein [Crassaminicella thermophila]